MTDQALSAYVSENPETSALFIRMATYAATATALTLAVVKIGAWLITDSVALLSSTVDSLLDVAVSIVNLLAVRYALKPADEDHRFGHGKAEPLAGLAQSAFVAGSGVFLLIQAGHRLYSPVDIERESLGIGVMAFSSALTLVLVAFQKAVLRRTQSVAIRADSLNYTGDILINASVIVSLIFSMTLDWHWVDPVFALGISAFLLRNAWSIALQTVDLLMDREFCEDDRGKILQIAQNTPGVWSAHGLRTRSSGRQHFIQLYLEMDRTLPLYKVHMVDDHVEGRIRKVFPTAEVFIHHDPKGLRNARICAMCPFEYHEYSRPPLNIRKQR